MTHPTDPLHEPMRLLRETSLPAGFEERLAERLALAHQEHVERQPLERQGVVRPHRFVGHRRTLLLLAAVALPAAAFASGGWLLEHRQSSTTPQTEAPLEAKPLPKFTQKPLSLPAPVIPPQLPAVEEPSVTEQSGLREPARSTSESKSLVGQDSKRDQDSNRDQSTRNQDSKRAGVSPANTPTTQTPAKIESLEISVPRAERAKGNAMRGTEKPPSGSLGLRRSSEPGTGRSSVEREHSSAQRESAGQQRGSDAAQQARERVQARERKGQ